MSSLDRRWKQFILNEGNAPDISVWLQSLRENINMMRPRSIKEGKRIELMKHQINEIRKASNRILRENKLLQEENQVLQEHELTKKEK